MNKTIIEVLGISEPEQEKLATVPHHWVEIRDGAVVFFADGGKAHFLAYPLVVLPNIARARFWEDVENMPLAHEIKSRHSTNNPVTAEEFDLWDWT